MAFTKKALDVTDAEGDDVTNDIFVGAKAELKRTFGWWLLNLVKEPGL